MNRLIRSFLEVFRLHINIAKTLYFNFRVFDFKTAIKFPVLLYGKIGLEGIYRRCVEIQECKFGSVRIGGGWYTEMFGYSNRHKSFLRIKGKLILGSDIRIQQGVLISVNEGAIIKIGNNVRLNERVTIHSKVRIDIEDNCRIGWNTQILDTSFHYMLNKGRLKYRNEPVVLRNNVWVANGVSIMKGSYLPSYTVVASNSLVNKDYSGIGEHCLIGGMPAKFITNGVERLLLQEQEIDRFFVGADGVLIWDDINEKFSK